MRCQALEFLRKVTQSVIELWCPSVEPDLLAGLPSAINEEQFLSNAISKDIKVNPSPKLGGAWEQSFVVSRGKQTFLRFVGNDGQNYRLMTATTGDEFTGDGPCHEKKNLIRAARILARNHGHQASEDIDGQGRFYVMPFQIRQGTHETDDDFTRDVLNIFYEFFEIFDGLRTDTRK